MCPFPRPDRPPVVVRWGRGRRRRQDKADLAVGMVRAGTGVGEGCRLGEGGRVGGTQREESEQRQEQRACCVHPRRTSPRASKKIIGRPAEHPPVAIAISPTGCPAQGRCGRASRYYCLFPGFACKKTPLYVCLSLDAHDLYTCHLTRFSATRSDSLATIGR